MSVIIKGMNMPKTCWECFVENQLNIDIEVFGATCPFAERIITPEQFNAKNGIHPDCPMVEPVRRGRWIGHHLSSMVTCSVCGVDGWNRYYSYCPNCGAKMEDMP